MDRRRSLNRRRTADFFNKEGEGTTGEPMDLQSKTVAELKDMLKEQGLPVSGNKSQLIERLEGQGATDAVLSLEDDVKDSIGDLDEEHVPWWRSTDILTPQALMAIGVVMLMITAVFVFRPTWLGFSPNYEYDLIDYDAAQTRAFAEDLVALGHPEWEGRMSGTTEEANTSAYIAAQFEAMGLSVTEHSYQVPMHHVNSEPSLRICVQGFGGNSPCEGLGSFGSQVIQFQHRIDYVIQGFSGRSEYTFDDDVQVTDVGNGTDDALWVSAAGSIGYVRSGADVGGNTGIFSKAAENNLAGLIFVNKDANCGQIEANDCVPIFKGSRIDEVAAANGGSIPSELPFIAMSKDAGEILEQSIFNATGPQGVLEMVIDVTNDQERTIYVPCGEIRGKSSEVVIVGGHHDTVYHGQGAVDDTSGTASVMEIARQLSAVVNESGTPERTLRFCTWGGEEEGLYGSRAYVQAFQNSLRDNLRLYLNLDMNHVDADMSTRGNAVTLFGNHQDDIDHVKRIAALYQDERSDVADRYDIRFATLTGDKVPPTACPTTPTTAPSSMIWVKVSEGEPWCATAAGVGNTTPTPTPWTASTKNRWASR